MKTRLAVVGALAAALTTTPLVLTSPAQAAPCVSGAEVRQKVATFVQSLRDDDTSAAARAALRSAFVESVRTARGAKADTPAERRGLGQEISALARQLRDSDDLVERKALIAEIHALQEQKRGDGVSGADVRRLANDVRAARRAIIGRVDTERERNQVSAFARTLIDQFDC